MADIDIQEYLRNDFKVYVDVTEIRTKDGFIRPVSFVWEDGNEYQIDRVVTACPGHSLKAGGYGIRYTVEIEGKRRYMFFEENKWFMERRRAGPSA